jgi:hypothetical protein
MLAISRIHRAAKAAFFTKELENLANRLLLCIFALGL